MYYKMPCDIIKGIIIGSIVTLTGVLCGFLINEVKIRK